MAVASTWKAGCASACFRAPLPACGTQLMQLSHKDLEAVGLLILSGPRPPCFQEVVSCGVFFVTVFIAKELLPRNSLLGTGASGTGPQIAISHLSFSTVAAILEHLWGRQTHLPQQT